MKFRKKPWVVEARQFDGTAKGWLAISEWIGVGPLETKWMREDADERAINIPTLEGVHTASPGDWIIKGIKGEFYPCKPDIFAATYEPAPAEGEGEHHG
jgi:hypothetical protein